MNHLLLLGACFMLGQNRNESTYPMLLVLLYVRTLGICIGFILFPTALSLSAKGRSRSPREPLFGTLLSKADAVDTMKVLSICRFTAVLLLLLSIGLCVFFCHVHSESLRKKHDRNRVMRTYDGGTEVSSFARGGGRRITVLFAAHLQVQREAWHSAKTYAGGGSLGVTKCPNVWGSAANTLLLLLSCGASVCACFYLLDSLPPSLPDQWNTPLRIGHFVMPLCVGAAGVGATHLHTRRLNTPLEVAEIVLMAVSSVSRLLYNIFPACVIVGWVIGSEEPIMSLDVAQMTLLSIVVVLPAHLLQSGSDDW